MKSGRFFKPGRKQETRFNDLHKTIIGAASRRAARPNVSEADGEASGAHRVAWSCAAS